MTQEQPARYPRVLRFVSEHPWAIMPSTLDMIVELLQLRVEGRMFTDEEIRARIGKQEPRAIERRYETVAVLPLHGPIAHRMDMMTEVSGGTSTEMFGKTFSRVVANPEVSAVVLDVDSPGGNVFGLEELAKTIYDARGSKPIFAVANTLMASAAYYIASQADRIIASPSSLVGSIGVMALHEDISQAAVKTGVRTTVISAGKYKNEGSRLEPLSDEAKAEMQKRVDMFYGMFVNAVARGRGVKAQQVRDGFGQGRVVGAVEAVKLGMADAVGTLDQAIEMAASNVGRRITASAVMTGRVPATSLVAQEPVEPNENGDCPEGTEMGDDGLCHPISEEARRGREEIAAVRKRLQALNA